VRGQRQRALLRGDVGDQPCHQRVLQRDSPACGGFDDGAAKLLGVHRPDERLRAVQRVEQFAVACAVAVEVGAHPDDDSGGAGGVGQGPHEPPAVCLRAGREDLLELVDHEQQVVGDLAQQHAQVLRIGGEFGADVDRGPLVGECRRQLGDRVRAGSETKCLPHWAARPARNREDLPAPDAPNTPTNGRSRTSASNLPTSASRPKNLSASVTWYAASPTYGASPWSTVSVASSLLRAVHSSTSPPQARTNALVTARLGGLRPAAASDSAAGE
jgi:hypothetical protein